MPEISRKPKGYTTQELDILLIDLTRGASLSELEVKLDRPMGGIAQKIKALSKQDPDTWNPEKAGEHFNEFRRQYHQEHGREYHKQYRQQHKDEIREQEKKRYHKRGGKEKRRQYYQEHKDEIRENNKQYHQQHKDEIREYHKQYRQQHKDEIREYHKQYRQQHKDEIRENGKRYRKEHKGEWKEFGNYLDTLLANSNGTKKNTAEELGIHPSLLSHYLAGNRKPNEEFLRRLSKRFDVAYQDLRDLIDR